MSPWEYSLLKVLMFVFYWLPFKHLLVQERRLKHFTQKFRSYQLWPSPHMHPLCSHINKSCLTMFFLAGVIAIHHSLHRLVTKKTQPWTPISIAISCPGYVFGRQHLFSNAAVTGSSFVSCSNLRACSCSTDPLWRIWRRRRRGWLGRRCAAARNVETEKQMRDGWRDMQG